MLELPKYKILVLSAHPDDETLGCGGTIHRLSNDGHEIHLLTFTDGVSSRDGNDKKNRNEKLEIVSDILGIKKYNFGDFKDNAMDSTPIIEVCKFIERNVKYTPDIIFTHNHRDLNIDHQIVAKATYTSFRPQHGYKNKIYSYFVPSSTDYNPLNTFNGNSYFQLSDNNVDAKLRALKIYNEEMRPYPHTRSYENIENLMKVWGSEIGSKYCEKFQLIRDII